jgi:hypothetical protein
MEKYLYDKFRECEEAAWQASFLRELQAHLRAHELHRLETMLDRFE